MAEFTPQEQEEFEFRMRMEQEQQQAAPQQETPNPNAVSASTNEILIPAAGAAVGAAARKLPEQFANMVKDPITGKWMALENYGRQMAGGKWYGGKHMGDVYERIVAAGADPAVAAKYEAEALQKMGKGSQLGAKLTSKLPDFVKPLATAPMGMLGRGLVGVGAGMQGADALNRYNEGDTSGAIVSGIGGLATAASMIPHPVARIGGTAVGLGAEGLNMFLDKLKNKKKMAHGGLVDEEDGLSKAEKAALKIMKKKKVKHFFLGGSVSSSIGPAIGAAPEPSPTTGGLAALVQGGNPNESIVDNLSSPPTDVSGQAPISFADLTKGNTVSYDPVKTQAVVGNGGGAIPGMNLFNPFGNSPNITATTQVVNQQGPVPAQDPYAGQPINMSVMGDDFGGGRPGTISAGAAQGPRGPALGGLATGTQNLLNPQGAAQINPNSPVAAASPPKVNFANAMRPGATTNTFNRFGTPLNQVRQTGMATPQARSPMAPRMGLPNLARFRRP